MPGIPRSCSRDSIRRIRQAPLFLLSYGVRPVPAPRNVHDRGCKGSFGIADGTQAHIPGGVAMRTARPRALWLAALFVVGSVGIIYSPASAQDRDQLVASL